MLLNPNNGNEALNNLNKGGKNKLSRMGKDQSKRIMERKLFKDMIMKGIGKSAFKKNKVNPA